MCTVTFLPLKNNNFIFTSNRDETPLRKTLPPKKYVENNVELIYPKDVLSGGTWIGISNKKRLVCLLNGGLENHKRKPPYKMSRGVVVKNMLSANDAIAHINEFDFLNIEPFTLIFVDYNKNLSVYELIWDGAEKHFAKLPNQPKIWSSSTLYTEDMKEDRQEWFEDWLEKNQEFYLDEILKFHQNSSKGTQETAVKMKRTFVETVSITSIEKRNSKILMRYEDLLKEDVKKVQMQ